MKNGENVVLDKELESVLCRSSFSRSYYRSGVLFAVVCSAVSIFSISHALSSGALISLHTPMFVVAVASLVLFLLSLVYIAVVCALEKRNRKSRTAEGKMSINSMVSSLKLNLKAYRSSKSEGGFSTFQVILVYGSIISLLVASASAGAIIGGGMVAKSSVVFPAGKGSTLVLTTASSTLAILMWISIVVFSVSVVMLFIARIFTEESKNSVRILVFPDCNVYCSKEGEGARSVNAIEASGLCEREQSASDVKENASFLGYVFSMLEGARRVYSVLGDVDHGYDNTMVVECVLSSESVGALRPHSIDM